MPMCPFMTCGAMLVGTTFAQRFTQACDDSKVVPEYGKGRQVAIAKRLKVTQEAVRKWFTGEAVPKPDKMKVLAEYLEVDESWLALDIKPELDRNQQLAKRKVVDGAVHMIAEMVMLEGGNVAFPGEKDPRAEYVDLYAIMRGIQMAVRVCVATEVSAGRYEFIIPRQYLDAKCIGFVALGGGKFRLLELSTEFIDEHKQRKTGDFVLFMGRIDNKYYSGQDECPRFKTISEIV